MANKLITICTVSFNNADHLALNLRLAEKMNPTFDNWRWVVAENSPIGAGRLFSSTDDHVRVIEGYREAREANVNHAEALHKCIRDVDSRFLLVMDPDFYLLKKNWAKQITDYMIAHSLDFLGTPWHPRFKEKYRYFPCVHCMFVDLERVSLEKLDYRPILNKAVTPQAIAQQYEYVPPEPWFYKITESGHLGRSLQRRYRKYIDTGSRIYHRFYKQSGISHECVRPVWNIGTNSENQSSRRFMEHFLPDRLSYYPNRRSYSSKGLLPEIYYEYAPEHWDEFVWRNEAFGFHVRRNANKSNRDDEDELHRLRIIIDGICGDR